MMYTKKVIPDHDTDKDYGPRFAEKLAAAIKQRVANNPMSPANMAKRADQNRSRYRRFKPRKHTSSD